MEEKRGFSVGQIMVAFVSGAVAGAVTALMTAPRAGRETRDQIGRFARDSAERIASMPGKIREKFHPTSEAIEHA